MQYATFLFPTITVVLSLSDSKISKHRHNIRTLKASPFQLSWIVLKKKLQMFFAQHLPLRQMNSQSLRNLCQNLVQYNKKCTTFYSRKRKWISEFWPSSQYYSVGICCLVHTGKNSSITFTKLTHGCDILLKACKYLFRLLCVYCIFCVHTCN